MSRPPLVQIADDPVDISCDSSMDDRLATEWDDLLADSDANVVFLTSGWLRAWHETLGGNASVVFCQVRYRGELVAVAAFQSGDGVVQFAGAGPSDYSDFVVRRDLNDTLRADLTCRLLCQIKSGTPGFRYFKLGRIQPDSRTLQGFSSTSNLYSTPIGSVDAPYMDMTCVDDRLRKKSLRRHERGLERLGKVECETFATTDAILPQLDEFFFDQHVRRWESSGVRSLFKQEAAREFYRCVTRRLGPTGQLRFTTIRLGGVPVAAHFGFLHANRFIWYKPTFEPTLSKLSPGEVLIKRLFEQAKLERAGEFDFTIGSEPFKFRFASDVRRVVYLHITDSRIDAYVRRGRALAGTTVRRWWGRNKTTREVAHG